MRTKTNLGIEQNIAPSVVIRLLSKTGITSYTKNTWSAISNKLIPKGIMGVQRMRHHYSKLDTLDNNPYVKWHTFCCPCFKAFEVYTDCKWFNTKDHELDHELISEEELFIRVLLDEYEQPSCMYSHVNTNPRCSSVSDLKLKRSRMVCLE